MLRMENGTMLLKNHVAGWKKKREIDAEDASYT